MLLMIVLMIDLIFCLYGLNMMDWCRLSILVINAIHVLRLFNKIFNYYFGILENLKQFYYFNEEKIGYLVDYY
jgi:hypothetical protein